MPSVLLAHDSPSPPASEAMPHSAEQTILIVDDDASLRNTAAMMLECHGFKTLVAGNGVEALERLQANPQVSVVLLDIHMPVMGGEEAFRQIRDFREDVPVILISGFELGEVAL